MENPIEKSREEVDLEEDEKEQTQRKRTKHLNDIYNEHFDK